MSDYIKAERVVSTALGLLVRETILPGLVWRDAAGDFRGAKDDTISIRLPAYAPARTRSLRSGGQRTKDSLHERKVDVTLETDVYKDVPISDEELTLDIANFGEQVLNPVLLGIALQLEQELADEIEGATYETEIPITLGSDDPYDIAVDAREALNKAHVPPTGRTLLVGAGLESAYLKSRKFVDASQSGSTQTLRNGVIGRMAGFDVVPSTLIDPLSAYAFHRTAFVLSSRAPVVPQGAPWGATQSFRGFAIRTVRVFDPDAVEDRFVSDSWVGTNVVTDVGTMDESGRFTPAEDPEDSSSAVQSMLVRAVKISETSSS